MRGSAFFPEIRLDAALFLLLFSLYFLLTPGHLFTVDSVEVYRTAESLVRDRDLEIVRPFPLDGVDTDRFYSKYGVGQVLMTIPLYLAGDAIQAWSGEHWTRLFQRPYPQGFGGDVHIFFAVLLNGVVTAATCVALFHVTVLLGYRRATALYLSLLYGLTTTALTQARDFFQHPLETLMLVLAFYGLLRIDTHGRLRWALFAGCALGFGLVTRLSTAVVLPLYLVAMFLAGPSTERVRRLAVFLAPIGLAGLVQLCYNQARYGSPWLFGYLSMDDAAGFSTSIWLGLYGNLFSAGRSIFLYSPPIAVALAGWPGFVRKAPRAAAFAIAVPVAVLVLYSGWHAWEGGWCWGPRFLLPMVPFLMLPLAHVIEQPRGWARALLVAGAVAGLAVQLLGSLVDYVPIYWQWSSMGLTRANAYLFHAGLSPIAQHWRALWAGKFIDLWLVYVYREFGLRGLVGSMILPVPICAGSILVLRRALARPAGDDPAA